LFWCNLVNLGGSKTKKNKGKKDQTYGFKDNLNE
jgi:hypothetical protein